MRNNNSDIQKKKKQKMSIGIIPPEVEDPAVIKSIERCAHDAVFLANAVLQNTLFSAIFKNGMKQINIGDFIGANSFNNINSYVERFSRKWFHQEEIKYLFTFRDVNLASQLVIGFTFYFNKVLKALVTSRCLFKTYRNSKFILYDDQSVWSEVFKYAAKEGGIFLEITPVAKTNSALSPEIAAVRPSIGMLKIIIMRLRKPDIRRIRQGGVLYSCALRFAEHLWESIDNAKTVYYLRPGFIGKKHRSILKSGQIVHNLVMGYFADKNDKGVYRKWIAERNISGTLDKYFSKNDFFNFEGTNIWNIVKKDLLWMLNKCLLEGVRKVLSFERMFNMLKPSLVIVEEDTCPFNRMLVDSANRRDVVCIQVLHGLLASNFLLDGVHSSRIIVPGEYARHRLIRWGIEEQKVLALGAPHYEKQITLMQNDMSRHKLSSKFRTSEDMSIITLFLSPVFTEKKPYFIDHPLTQHNMQRMVCIAGKAVHKIKNAKLIIKKHQMDYKKGFIENEVKRNRISNDVIILEDYDSMELVASSDIVLCSGSTVYLEALLLKVPVVIFDDFNKRFWEDLKSEYLDLGELDESVETICKIVEDAAARHNRLDRQEEELSWHFVDKNVGSQEKFRRILENMVVPSQQIKPQESCFAKNKADVSGD